MIRVESLTRTYGDFTAVDQVSFDIAQGEIVGLLGHNGAGKTTIMKMMTGFLEPTSGVIKIDGLDLLDNLQEVQQNIGYLPENCPVYPEMSVVDYLDYAASLHGVEQHKRGERIRDVLAKTELTDRAFHIITTLSRGLRQRVGVAQALLHEPKILILDEPTNGLDPTQIQHMRGLIRTLAEHATIILCTHILQEVQALCDRVIIVRNGSKVMDATLEDLRSGNRLLIGLNADLDKTRNILGSISEINQVELLQQQDDNYQYALSLNGHNHQVVAARVARTILDDGCDLFSLTQENRDLETIFGEISQDTTGGAA